MTERELLRIKNITWNTGIDSTPMLYRCDLRAKSPFALKTTKTDEKKSLVKVREDFLRGWDRDTQSVKPRNAGSRRKRDRRMKFKRVTILRYTGCFLNRSTTEEQLKLKIYNETVTELINYRMESREIEFTSYTRNDQIFHYKNPSVLKTRS